MHDIAYFKLKDRNLFSILLGVPLLLIFSCTEGTDKKILGGDYAEINWPSYLGDKGVTHYSQLDQVNRENVGKLQVAWEFDNGEADPNNRSMIQCNPLIIDGTLYGTTATLKVFALDAATGQKKWMFNPDGDSVFSKGINRGLAYWQDGNDRKLFYATGEYLLALDPGTGQLIRSFGKEGIVNLLKGLGREVDGLRFHMNTPGIIHKDLYIVGGKVSETVGHVPGHIRAYDVHTGEIEWIFHTIPHPGEYGYETWSPDAWLKSGGANVWAGFSLDVEREIVYAPTGSPSFDFYGGDRIGSNLFGNSIIALDANTGKRIWHFQTVHHDLWDRDLSSPPTLATIKKDGKDIDVVVQSTKMGLLFVLNRETGEPIYPIEEVPVPQSEVEGEATWPTQPFPTVYPPFSRITMTEEDLATRTDDIRDAARKIWDAHVKGNMYDPPSIQGTINFPGYYGGGEWGGGAIDPTTGTYYINSNNFPWELKVTPFIAGSPGSNMYKMYCVACHGNELEGSSMFGNVPALVNIKDRLSRSFIQNMITNGKGNMPSYKRLGEEEINQIVDFLIGNEKDTIAQSEWPYPYNYHGHRIFNMEDGHSMIKPPWGQLTAIDLNNAKIKWQIPLGNYDTLDIPGHPITGTPNFGGPVVTAGGLLFIAATADRKIRAFDKGSGVQLWEATLPTQGSATPSIYSVNGKQYIVIACGGGRFGTKSGDAYVAFSLP